MNSSSSGHPATLGALQQQPHSGDATPAAASETTTTFVPRKLTAEQRQQILFQFEEAIKSIPLEKKQAYLEARQQAPRVVARETDPLPFLRYCQWNFWTAAKRLCVYWKERKELFQERAFLPLTLNEGGALTPDDILTIQAGYPAMLPRTSCGRQVFLMDRSQFLPTTSRLSRIRAHFYMVNKGMKEERAQTPGGVVILALLMQPRRLIPTDDVLRRKLIYLAEHAFPIDSDMSTVGLLPKTLRGAPPSSTGGVNKKTFCQQLIHTATAFPRGRLRKVKLYIEKNEEDLRHRLLDLGSESG
uniref:CRAL-TRIO domain-containing protein n=1 Tax=Entomoneis paludosa TaxID=265537 RepID=A0A7S2VAL9_9STRA|mmetsp:Transcript_14634/g.30222  ORF Transcript_14634/g.30222 Transcript_14634/m.30222 type:complete len:301 (+) Transcript_14634:53-955(+)|eukprot:CAMPEP_0172459978 /NCGR_PEP_ID=MMETSP1065-20121228/35017_1 /TAXON_ID=265537 /ORGANISM="Amphiprora paludosa, Strain CCMP125" /LENGTH=300 /DNA_ID=CAMNT_0013214863 /DNA_START=24 /DNA_END=926 /DNA_ORIENTATION=-